MPKKLVNKIKSKVIEPKVWSVIVKSGAVFHLWTGVAYTLDDAFILAKQAATKAVPDIPFWELWLHAFIEVGSLNAQLTDLEIEEVKIDDDKNELMKTIIDNKDEVLYKKEIAKFSAEERQLIEDKLKI